MSSYNKTTKNGIAVPDSFDDSVELAQKEQQRSNYILELPNYLNNGLQGGQANWFDSGSYHQLSNEGYRKNIIVHRCINMIAQAIGALDWQVCNANGDLLPEVHPAMQLFERPFPTISGKEFFTMLMIHKLISGSAFIRRTELSNGNVSELELLRPDMVQVEEGRTIIPKHYRYTSRDSSTIFPVDQVTGDSDVLWIYQYDPTCTTMGLSPLAVAAREVAQHNEGSEWNKSLLENSGRPSSLITMEEAPGDTEIKAFNEHYKKNHVGAKNAGKPLFLGGTNVKYNAMGMTPMEVDFLNSRLASERSISKIFGVPHQLLGDPDASTYNNLAEMKLFFYENTVLEHAAQIIDEFNHWLMPMFGDVKLSYDEDQIQALAPRRAQKVESVLQLRGLVTDDEAREMLGLGPKPSEPTVEDTPDDTPPAERSEEIEDVVIAEVIEEEVPEIVEEIVEEERAEEIEDAVVEEDAPADIDEQLKDEIEIADNIEEFRSTLSEKDAEKFQVRDIPINIDSLDDEGTFVGYASVFGVVDGHNTSVAKGAFKRTLNTGAFVEMLWQHNVENPIGVYDELYEDDYGLVVKGRLALESRQGKDAYELLKIGAMKGLSIGFVPVNGKVDKATKVTTFTEVKLKEVSVVTRPSNMAAEVTAIRSVPENLSTSTVNKETQETDSEDTPLEDSEA